MMTTVHPLAADYLRRLERAARSLSRRERDELLAEIRGHIDAGLAQEATTADVHNLLDELGPPESIVAAARPEPAARRGAREVFALLLLVTGLPPVVGWLVGVGLLWWSPLWSTRQKVLGTLVWPGGYVVLLGAGIVVSPLSCPAQVGDPSGCAASGPSFLPIVLIGLAALAPLLVAGHLYRAAGRRSAD